jgi:hypothetical protein
VSKRVCEKVFRRKVNVVEAPDALDNADDLSMRYVALLLASIESGTLPCRDKKRSLTTTSNALSINSVGIVFPCSII